MCCRMLLTLLYSCTGGAAVLYALYRWIIPFIVQYHAGLALIWHDQIVEGMLDMLTRSTRPQVCRKSTIMSQQSIRTFMQLIKASVPLQTFRSKQLLE